MTMQFAQILKKLMDEQGLTNYQLAKNLDIHPTTITNWLSGKEPRKMTLVQLSNYFNVSVDYLLGKEGQKEKEPDLTDEDRRDIARMLGGMVDQLGNHNVALMFDGEPVDEETKELLKISLENQFRLAKKLMQKRKSED